MHAFAEWLSTTSLSVAFATTFWLIRLLQATHLLTAGVALASGLAIALRVLMRLLDEDDLFTILAAAGLTAQLVGQAFINIGGVTATMPVTGLTLPFISYVGTALVTLFIGIGILMSLRRQRRLVPT